MQIRLILAAVFLVSFAQSADAHLRLTSHQARYGDASKPSPCGQLNGVRTTDKVYIAKPGTQVTIVWDEYINHPGWYRIDFDLDGDDGFLTPVVDCPPPKNDIDLCFNKANVGPYMVNNILDEAAAVQNYVYTLPDVECDNCTLQVIQVMTDKAPYEVNGNEIYHQCVDIILDNNGPDVLTLVGAGDTPDAGPGDPDAGDVNPADPDAGIGGTDPIGGDSGCGCQSSGSGSGVLLLLVAAALWWRRPRRAYQN